MRSATMAARMNASRPRAVLLTLATRPDPPWWWAEVDHARLCCEIAPAPILLPRGRPTRLLSLRFFSMVGKCVGALVRARRERAPFVLTFEGGWLSFIVAGTQTLLGWREPRHVILQFIMRERTDRLGSRLKYAFMKWSLASVYRCICSARLECDYYAEAFGWPREKLLFAPFHTTRQLLERAPATEEPFAIAAGRTFRDYRTLLEAYTGIESPLVIVATPAAIGDAALPPHVSLRYDIPLESLMDLIARSSVVVLPLAERQISIGQSVLLQAMAMGKAVVVTRVNGTIDYVEHMVTGVLVPPHDAAALRDAILTLDRDPALRRRLGDAAREQVVQRFLPEHYAVNVARLLGSETR
jgi:glycosyltransferase involved in cell wall biosynthesis